MSIVAGVIEILAAIVSLALWVYLWLVIARPIVSWVGVDRRSPIVQFLDRVTEPVLGPVRRLFPLSAGGFDFTPVVVFFAILILQQAVLWILYQIANTLRFMG